MSLTIYKGVTWKKTLTVTDQTGARVDLTGAAIAVRAKKHTSDPNPPVFDLEVGSGVTLRAQSGGTLGQADVQLDGTASAAIPADNYVINVVVTPSGQLPQVVVPPTKLPIRDVA